MIGPADPLLEAIRAAPDDDDARLVWADREGGERGELVVVQCALERMRRVDEATRAEMKRLFAREAELMKSAKKWPGFTRSARVRRGFVEHLVVRSDELLDEAGQAELFARAPLLESIELADTRQAFTADWRAAVARVERALELLPPGRIRAVTAGVLPHLHADVDEGAALLSALVATKAGRAMRSIDVRSSRAENDIAPLLLELRELETLSGVLERAVAAWPLLLAELPALTQVGALRVGTDVVRTALNELANGPSRLAGLSLNRCGLDDDDARLIARSPAFAGLTSLTIANAELTFGGVEALAASPHLAGLTSLDLSGNRFDDAAVEALASASFAPRLRSLSLCDAHFTAAATPHLLAFPALERVSLRTGYGSTDALHAIDDVIPSVSR